MAKLVLCAAVFSGCLGMFSLGLSIGWGSPSVPLLKKGDSPMTSYETTWAVSILKIGALIGAVATIFFVDTFGRKNMLLFSTFPTSIGWLLIGFAKSPVLLCVGRMFTGFSTGLLYCVTPTYLSEISPAKVRGALGISCTLAMYCAVTYAFSAGPFISISTYAFIAAGGSIIHGIIILAFLPETPYYLMRRKRYAEAKESLQKLRGSKDVEPELISIQRISEETIVYHWKKLCNSVLRKDNLKTLLLGLTLVLMNALSGEIIVLNNAETLFGKIENNFLDANYLSVILALAQIVIYPLCMYLVDKRGRKPLLLTSSGGIVICSVAVGCYFFLKENGHNVQTLGWLPSAGFIMLIISASLGLVPITVLMVSEIFPMHIKFICVGLCTSIFYLFSFAELQLFMIILEATNGYTTFWILAVLNVLNGVMVYFWIPETKGQSLEEIQIKMSIAEQK